MDGLAARTMSPVLVEHVRKREALRQGGRPVQVRIHHDELDTARQASCWIPDMLDLSEAHDRLAEKARNRPGFSGVVRQAGCRHCPAPGFQVSKR